MQHAGVGAGCLLGYWRVGDDALPPSGGRRTEELQRKDEITAVMMLPRLHCIKSFI